MENENDIIYQSEIESSKTQDVSKKDKKDLIIYSVIFGVLFLGILTFGLINVYVLGEDGVIPLASLLVIPLVIFAVLLAVKVNKIKNFNKKGLAVTLSIIATLVACFVPNVPLLIDIDKRSNFGFAEVYGGYEFIGCNDTSKTSVKIPSTYLGKPVISIGEEAFRNCSSLQRVKIPNSVTSIGYCAFENCSSLTSIEIPNSVTSIGFWAFSCCDKLQYNVEGNLKYLGNDSNKYVYLAGATSTNITTATINSNCKIIGDSAFYNYSSLTSIEIPNSVTSISDRAFIGCTIESATMPTNAIDSMPKDSLKNVVINGGTSIYHGAFYDCISLTSIVIPNSVTLIGTYAFSGCTSLTGITIPNSVTTICYGAFRSCTSLTSIVIPNSVTSIDSYAFENCTSLTICCETNSMPIHWHPDWNYSGCPVEWGYKPN